MDGITVLYGLLGGSSALNLYLLILLSRKKKAEPSTDLKEFIVDLMHGKMGMIAVARVNPDDILLRAPRKS